MPDVQRQNVELPEKVWRGPFGGIQSELPLDSIPDYGFADTVNLICRKGNITTRPGYSAFPAIPNPQEPIVGIADFFNSTGARIQVVITPTRLIKFNPGSPPTWTVITGTLTGSSSQYFSWSVLDNFLLFSQGTDPVQKWDGITAGFSVAAAAAVPARYLCEMAFHLVVGYTFESATSLPQQIRWTDSLDPTDWTSFNSGFEPLANDLGPITGLVYIYQTGYAFQQKGVVQIIPTGVGVQPFDFVKIASKSYGCVAPFSLAGYGSQIAIYVGKDNVYQFDGTSFTPIGDAPISGTRARLGARKRIFAELKTSNLNQVFGFITESIAGNDYNAYWLVIPNGSLWIYNIDEGNWTRHVLNKIPQVLGDFATQSVPRIMDLVGTIAAQTWSPATLTATSPLDDLAIGFSDGTVGDVNFSTYSETAWSITSGQCSITDVRHNKLLNRFRAIFTDIGMTTFQVSITNEKNFNLVRSFTGGNGSGQQIEALAGLEFNISGLYFIYNISGSQPTSFSEFAMLYSQAGEYKGT